MGDTEIKQKICEIADLGEITYREIMDSNKGNGDLIWKGIMHTAVDKINAEGKYSIEPLKDRVQYMDIKDNRGHGYYYCDYSPTEALYQALKYIIENK